MSYRVELKIQYNSRRTDHTEHEVHTDFIYFSNFDSETPIVVFLDLIELYGQDAANIEKVLWLNIENIGIFRSFALKNWIASASTRALTKSGVAAYFCEKIPQLFK